MAFTRSGGIVAGNTLQTEVDLGAAVGGRAAEAAEVAEVAELAELLDQVDLADLAERSPLRGPGADTYQYELTVEQGDRREHVTVDDTEVPAELRPVIRRLEARAVEERRRRR